MSRRPRGDGAIYPVAWADDERTKPTRYEGQLDLGPDPVTGKRRRRKVRGANKSEIARRFAQIRRAEATNLDVSKRAPTVEEVVKGWLELGAPGPRGVKQDSTLSRLRRRIDDHLIPGVGRIRIDELRPEHIEDWLRREASKGQRRSTLLDYRADLSQVLRWALGRRLIAWNPAQHAVVPDGEPARAKKALSRAERDRLYAALDHDRLGAYFTILAELGLRPGEADALAWDDVDLEDGALYVTRAIKRVSGGEAIDIGTPKTAKSRRGIELTPRCVEALRRRKAEQAAERLRAGPHWTTDGRWAGLVFTSELGTPMHPSNTRRSLAKLCERAKVPKVSPYELRHTATTILAEDVPLIRVADQLGHTDTRMVERVYRKRPEVVRTAAEVERQRAVGS